MFIKMKGLTLVEIIIALGLSSMIMLSSFYLLQHGLRFYYQQQQKIDDQQQQRYAQYLLTRVIRMAGYLPCGALQHSSFTQLDPPLQIINNFSHKKQPWLTSVAEHSDILQVTAANPKFSLTAYTNRFVFSKPQIISNCNHTMILPVGKTPPAEYRPQFLSSSLQTTWFYLRKDISNSHDGLFMRDSSGRAEEILPHVKQINFSFADSSHHYLSSKHIHNWQQIHYCQVSIVYENQQRQLFTVRLRNT